MLELFKKRRACRKFDSKKVEEEKIKSIVEAGLYAPSGMGRQTPVIIAISDKETRDKLAKLNAIGAPPKFATMDPFYNAPTILLVIAHKDGLSIYDGSATIENMLLEATNQGLGSCWIHRANDEIQSKEGRELLSFTNLNFDDYVGIGHVALGYSLVESYPEKVIKEGRVFYK